MEIRKLNIANLEEVLQEAMEEAREPSKEEIKEKLQLAFTRIRDAFEPVSKDDGDALMVLDFLEIMEPASELFGKEFEDVSPAVRKAVAEMVHKFGEAFAELSSLADVRLRAQGRFYELDLDSSNASSEPEGPDNGGGMAA